MKNYDEAIKCCYIAVSLCIITKTHIELIPILLEKIIKNFEDNADAITIKTIIRYLNNEYTECINITNLKSLKGLKY